MKIYLEGEGRVIWERQGNRSPDQLRSLAAPARAQESRVWARAVRRGEEAVKRADLHAHGKGRGPCRASFSELLPSLFLLHSSLSPPNRGLPVSTSFLDSTLF